MHNHNLLSEENLQEIMCTRSNVTITGETVSFSEKKGTVMNPVSVA